MNSMPTWTHFLAVGVGAATGAVGRWLLGMWLNSAHAIIPWGTLAANLAGAYLIGLVLGWIVPNPGTPEWARLFLTTGFLGGLTTFSTFSAETLGLLVRGAYWPAFLYSCASLLGALLLTAAGWITINGLSVR